jgi:hypothetical protein
MILIGFPSEYCCMASWQHCQRFYYYLDFKHGLGRSEDERDEE